VATRARVIAPIALALLSVAAGLSLGRVFDSGEFVLPVVGAALVPHAVGLLSRRRGWSAWVWLALVVGALVLYVGWVLLGPTTWFGLPRGSTFQELGDRLRDGWHVLRRDPAPAPVTGGTELLAVLATWTVATVADWLAFERHTTLAALSPALVLFVWSSTLGTDEHEMITVAGFAVAAGLFLVVQNVAVLDRRRSWLVSSQPTRAHWIVPAVVLGVVALVVGIVLAPALPGAESDPLLDFGNRGPERGGGGGSYSTSVPPLVDVGAKLRQPENTEVFTVRAAQPEYWRLTALDEFSSDGGGQWTLSAEGSDEVTTDIPEKGEPGTLRQQYTIGSLGERWMPAAFDPVATDTPALQVIASGTLVTDDPDGVQGLVYSAYSRLAPSARDVTDAQKAATAEPVPSEMRRYLALPDIPSSIGDEARRVVTEAGATTPYAQAEALRDYFWADYEYDLNVDTGDGTDAISAFLRDRRGFCVQFASTYAVMARTLGIPSRVAVGFTHGDQVDDEFSVRAHHAHAWPEIYLSGLGWTHLFDPTPPADSNPLGQGSALPGDPPRDSVSTPATATTAAPSPTATTTPDGGSGAGGTAVPPTTAAPPPLTVSTAEPSSGRGPWVWLLAIALVAAVIVAVYVALVLTAKSRRRTRRREAEPSVAVQGAWDEALDRLRDAHVEPDPALTPLELARRAPSYGATAATRPLRSLARSYTIVRYGESGASREEADRAWAAVEELDAALDADLSRRERWRRRLDPSTLRARARV
jgi:hypothetical protein